MFYIARFRRAKQPTTAPQPATPAAAEPPAVALLLPTYQQLVQSVILLSFRVGEYEIGEVYRPNLYGHPGIRY